MQSSKIFAKTMAPKIIQDVVLIHPPKAVAAGAIPLIKYKDGSRIAGMIVSKKSKAQTKIINTVITKKVRRSFVNKSLVGIRPIPTVNRISSVNI